MGFNLAFKRLKTFRVHSGIPNAYTRYTCTFAAIILPIVSVWDPRIHSKTLLTLDLYFRRPEDEQKESKHVALK